MIMEHGESGGVYNLATNEPHTIGDVLLTLIDLAGIEAEIVEDNGKVRPQDESSPRLDMSKLSGLGFRFEKSFKDTMAEVLEEWINKLDKP
jgi:nucleoside-diphosphate-sugar epimerase